MATVAPEISVLARDQGFEALYRRYVGDVYRYALALMRNPADAEDVVQTTFMNAYRALKRGDQVQRPQNWLIKIAHNTARTRYALAGRRVREVPLDDHAERLAVPEDERPNIEALLHALGRLPFNQRAALVMRELEGRSYGEIADTLGVSVPAVETLIFRARKGLRLRASAIRALAAVPLPSSLAKFIPGGGTAAGGAGSAASGLVLKGAVVLVAGAIATGVGGRQPVTASAAPEHPSTASLAGSTVTGAQARPARHAPAPSRAKPASVGLPAIHGSVPSVGALHAAPTRRHNEQLPKAPPAERHNQIPIPLPPAVESVKSSVEQAVGSVAAQLPLPVPVPSLPSVPDSVPLPQLPPLP